MTIPCGDEDRLPPKEILAFVIHEDRLKWSRLQALAAVQAGVLAASYAVRHDLWFATSIVVAGIILSVLLFFLMQRDQLIRDANIRLVSGIVTDPPRRWFAPLRGREILRIAFVVLVFVDFSFIVALYCAW